MYFNRRGEPIDDGEWGHLLGTPGYARVELTQVRDATTVSTVWLGLDHAFDDGPPIIFETMVFDLVGYDDHDPQWRYSTEAEARTGHWSAVAWVQDMLRVPRGSQEDRIVPDDGRPLADVEPGSVDITALDKAELLAALHNATRPLGLGVINAQRDMTHEQAAAIIQDRLGAGTGAPFYFDYLAGRPIKCDLTGPRISAHHVALYDSDAGAGTMARVVGELRAAYERRRAERAEREG